MESMSNVTRSDINEVKKWIAMGFTKGQIAKKMGWRSQKAALVVNYLRERPYG